MLALLADIGSTFTKMTVVDLEREEVAATAQSPTTIADINLGLQEATRRIEEHTPLRADRIAYRMACSSAAGGLRMVTVGLIPDLTGEAAKRAALGAGAKVVGVFAHHLTRKDLTAIAALKPDILLLTGGTDGGNERAILHNAAAIAQSGVRVPVVVAGNRAVADQVGDILQSARLEVWVTENVMPEVGELNVGPAQAAIREVFLKRIIVAKGLDKAQETFGVVMPTPSAVLRAAELLSVGCA
ncbi:MAG: glutamate mutase L, partial [Anaerolineae bacterium]